MTRLAARVALVTGGARGIGKAVVQRFAEEGAVVVVADVDGDAARRVAASLGGQAFGLNLDVSRMDEWDIVAAEIVDRFGGLDILVNNAGFGALGPLETVPLDTHHRLIDVNLHGTFYGMRACAPALRAGGSGAIVNISSIDGMVGVRGMTSYSASKFAVRGMSRSAAVELGRWGIRVNSVHPGVTDTPLVRGETPEGVDYESLRRIVQMQPIPRLGRPEEIANVVLFLASDEASYCTGAEFVVDGGHIAGAWREPL